MSKESTPEQTLRKAERIRASALAPENTRAAFRRARELGASEVETDVRLTHDGQVVLFHDSTLLGKLGLDIPVETMTLDELQGMNISSWFFRDGYKALNDPDAGWHEGELQRGSGGCVMGLDSYLDEFGFDFHQQFEGCYGNMKPTILVLHLFHRSRLKPQWELQIFFLNYNAL